MSTNWLNIKEPCLVGAGSERGEAKPPDARRTSLRSAAAVGHAAAERGRRLAHGDVRRAQSSEELGRASDCRRCGHLRIGAEQELGVALAVAADRAHPRHGIEVAQDRLAVGRLGVRGARFGPGDVLRRGSFGHERRRLGVERRQRAAVRTQSSTRRPEPPAQR